jgi:outer membrane biosynthesis protein TonB
MRDGIEAGGLVRWSVAVGGAFLMHGALWLAWPASRTAEARAAAPLVWLDAVVVSGPSCESEAQTTSTSTHAATVPSVPTKARATKRAHARRPEPAMAPKAPVEGPDRAAPEGDLGPSPAVASHSQPSAGQAFEAEATRSERGGRGEAGRAGVGSAAPHAPTRPPGLLAFGDPCHGFYPAAAKADHGEVRVVVRVERDGRTLGSEVIAEVPARQGFAAAARSCVSRLRFRPARDAEGGTVPGRAVLALSFDRT